MRLSKKTVLRSLLAAAALIVAVGLIAPRLDAGRFRERIKSSLRAALGREVDVTGEVRLDLFNGPGFSVDKVVVHDDPAIGLEPLAYVESLEARVSFASFWTGRLEFSNLRLLDASINLARPEGGHWNFESLLSRTAGASREAAARLPHIEVRSSRINFRFGETKSLFYVAEARLDATPPASSGDSWRVQFEGEPARTDRSSHGFGRFTARGRWRPANATAGRIDATIELERGSLSDLISLAHGHDIGVHGHVSTSVRLAGPPSEIRVAGRLQIGDFHRWDLLPPRTGGWPLEYRGTLDLVGQTLRLETAAQNGAPPPPVGVQFRATGVLSQPRWAALLTLNRLPLAPLTEVARHMGVALPEALTASGELTGIIGYTPDAGMQGMLGAAEALVTVPDTPPIRLQNALVRLDREAAHLEPADFTAGAQAAAIEGEYDWSGQAWKARITAGDMAIASAAPAGARLLDTVPLLARCTRGNWSGELDYRKEGDRPGQWTGTFRVAGASLPVPGVADPLEIASARVTVRADGFSVDHLKARAGAAEFTGEYRYSPDAAHPHQLELSIPKLTAEELERLLLPALHRNETLLSRALRLGRTTVPEWLENRRLDATIEIGALAVDDFPFEKVRTHLRWEGAGFEAADLTAHYSEGTLAAHLTANLKRSAPAYHMALRFRGLGWMGGTWTGRSSLETSGTGRELLRNLRLSGNFKARTITLAADTEARDASGAYSFAMQGRVPTFRFSDVLLTLGDASFKGQGATGTDGRVHLDLSDGQKQMRLSATVSPFQLELSGEHAPGTP
jgi:hypothetical protein